VLEGINVDVRKKVLLIGITVAVLSAAVATQYARITIGYEFSVVHPSNGFIRFVAMDNSTDGRRLLRIEDNDTATMTIKFGDIPKGMNKTYTAAFAIVNEEGFPVNITGVSVSGTGASFIRIWLHADPTVDAASEAATAKLLIWDGSASQGYWILDTGDMDNSTMETTSTPWDTDDNIRYAAGTPSAIKGSTDFVWVQISIDTSGATKGTTYTGSIEFQFKAET